MSSESICCGLRLLRERPGGAVILLRFRTRKLCATIVTVWCGFGVASHVTGGQSQRPSSPKVSVHANIGKHFRGLLSWLSPANVPGREKLGVSSGCW